MAESTNRSERNELRKANRERFDRVTVVPLSLLHTVSRGALALYVALSDYGQPTVVVRKSDGTRIDLLETLLDGELSHGLSDEARDTMLSLADPKVHVCWPSAAAIADQIPATVPVGTTAKKSIWPWLDELILAGWVMRFNRTISAEGKGEQLPNAYLLAKSKPFGGQYNTSPTPEYEASPLRRDQPKKALDPTDQAETEDYITFGADLPGTSGDLGDVRYLPVAPIGSGEDVEF